jgi:hypothetical protein
VRLRARWWQRGDPLATASARALLAPDTRTCAPNRILQKEIQAPRGAVSAVGALSVNQGENAPGGGLTKGGCSRTDGSTPGSGFFGTRLAVVSDRVVARRELGLEAAITKLDKYHLLILDDIAYVTNDQAETSVMFELIAARHERRFLLITANQPFGDGQDFRQPSHDAGGHRSARAPRHDPGDERRELSPEGRAPPQAR